MCKQIKHWEGEEEEAVYRGSAGSSVEGRIIEDAFPSG